MTETHEASVDLLNARRWLLVNALCARCRGRGWVSRERMSRQLLRTSRYYMPPRITRNSHRPSRRGWSRK